MSSLAQIAASPALPRSTPLRRTVAVVDMVGYSTIARLLEENISVNSVTELNQQIQTFITRSLDHLPRDQTFFIVSRTGDGIIILFNQAEDAHHFAQHVHLFAREHNHLRSEATAQRWFRIGIATGDVSETASSDLPSEYAGTAIANAVRLECSARPGEIVIDAPSFALLSPESKLLYPLEETIRGKRNERFRARRLRVVTRPKPAVPHPSLSRRTFLRAGLAIVGAASLGVWFERSQIDNWMHPLPAKRFVALLGWPPPRDADVKPMLMGLIDVIVTELARAEAFDSNLFLTTQGTAADLTTAAQVDEAQASLGANLILATSVSRIGAKTKVLLQILDSPTSPPLRTHTLTLLAADQDSLPRQTVTAAARLLDIDRYQPDEQRLRTGTGSTDAYALFQQAEALVKQPNDAGLDAAIAKYQQAAAADPRYAAAYAKLALAFIRLYVVHLDAAALEIARANALTALHLDSSSVDAHIALAGVLSRTGEEEKAFREFASALSLDPSNPRTLIEQARLYASLNRWDRAEDTFNRVLRARPNLWLAHLELGVLLSQQAKYPKALSEFRAATMAQPSQAVAFSNIGAILLLQGKLVEAIESLQHSFDLKPGPECASNLAAAYRVQRKPEQAVRYALKAVELSPADALSWLELGDCYSLSPATRRDALQAYLRAVKAQRNQLDTETRNGPGWMVLALTSVKSGNLSSARSWIAHAEFLAANDVDSQLYKARTLELLGDRAGSLTAVALCLGRGATSFQFQLSPDMDALRDDPRYQQLIAEQAPNRFSL